MESTWTGPQFGIHPNPFNPQTRISFRLPDSRHVLLRMYDVRGRQVATLVDGQRAAGAHVLSWDGRTDRGMQAGTGTYFLVLQAGDIRETRKLIVLK
jgi:flagellar hook assembly protein FlgD